MYKMEAQKLKTEAIQLMLTRAIASGRKHGIKLTPGRPNPANGDCAFEAAVFNVNDRSSFSVKYPMSIDYYRRIWSTDMANRTVDTAYNILGSKTAWYKAWKDMQEPGRYEQDIFGDLMLPGIACGLRKMILIFNTNINSPHGPIYIIDPSIFNVMPDTAIPIVLAYNLYHYESLHPCTSEDVQLTVNLVKEYQEGRYRFSREDFQFLLNTSVEIPTQNIPNITHPTNIAYEKRKNDIKEVTTMVRAGKCKSNDRDFLDKHTEKLCKEGPNRNSLIHKERQQNTVSKVIIQVDKETKMMRQNTDLIYSLKKNDEKYSIREENGKMECPFCHNFVKNISIHFTRSANCGSQIRMNEFMETFKLYKKEKEKLDNRRRQAKHKEKQQNSNPEKFNREKNEAVKKSQAKKKASHGALYFADQANAVTKYQEKKKNENKAKFDEKNLTAVTKCQEKDKNKNKVKFDENNLNAVTKCHKKKKITNKAKFDENNLNAVTKCQENKKIKNKAKFDENNLNAVTKCHKKKKIANKAKFDENNLNAVIKCQKGKKLVNETDFDKRHLKAVVKHQEKKKAESKPDFDLENKIRVERARQKKDNNSNDRNRIKNFNRANLLGPIFICSCCKRRLFENSVSQITEDFKLKVQSKREDLFNICLKNQVLIKLTINGKSDKTGNYICGTCKDSMLLGKIPAMAEANGLTLVQFDEDLNLTELENNLIALNINFQYIFFLKKSRWAATKKQMISVPVPQHSVLNTVEMLPRIPKEAGLIPVTLKRKLEYKSYHRKEYVNPDKIFKILDHLKQSGHPYYQFYDDYSTFRQRCKTYDEEGHDMLFGNNSENEDNCLQIRDEIDNTEADLDSEEDEKNIQRDPIRRHQFQHDRNTCLTNNYPEVNVDQNGNQVNKTKELMFAPAEGNFPANLLSEKDWDIKSWPTFHPDGRFGLHHKRKVKLTDQQYFGQRILNEDLRFSKSPSFIFGAAAYIEQKQLISHANISFMRGRRTTDKDGKHEYDLDDAFTTFDGVKNTPKYWQKVKYDMIAKLENNGPFHLFFTLSCGDTRWSENFSAFLEQNGHTLKYFVNEDGTTEVKVVTLENLLVEKELKQFLQEDVNESLHEMIRTNVITATRNFHHRVETFKREIIFGKNSPMKVKHISYRVEFQGRGAAHIHGTLWLDIKSIEKELSLGNQQVTLQDAFMKLRNDICLNESEKEAVAKFTDKFISCSLNPTTIHEDPAVGARIINIVKSVNCHNCTGPCAKYGDRCKYNFPRYPIKETMVIDKK